MSLISPSLIPSPGNALPVGSRLNGGLLNPMLRPERLSLTDDKKLAIAWSDGTRRIYDPAELRRVCPCATCRDAAERQAAGLQGPTGPGPEVRINAMTPVGNYAYRIVFSDGHDTGLFTLELLRRLGEETS